MSIGIKEEGHTRLAKSAVNGMCSHRWGGWHAAPKGHQQMPNGTRMQQGLYENAAGTAGHEGQERTARHARQRLHDWI